MSVNTVNAYGKIIVTDNAISSVASFAAMDCYGVVDLVSQRILDSFSYIFKSNPTNKGIKVQTKDNHIKLQLFVILKYGVSISAVAESLKKAVKYSVEEFTGMIVDSVDVQVVGVRV